MGSCENGDFAVEIVEYFTWMKYRITGPKFVCVCVRTRTHARVCVRVCVIHINVCY